jgi:hypothetical protein
MTKMHNFFKRIREPDILLFLAIPGVVLWFIYGPRAEPIAHTLGLRPDSLFSWSIPAFLVFLICSLFANINKLIWRLSFSVFAGVASTFIAVFLIIVIGCLLPGSSCI